VAKNSVAQAVRFGATAVSKFLIVVVIARMSGVQQVGDYSFVMTFTVTLGFLNNFGLNVLVMRDIAQQRERLHKYIDNALTLSAGLGLLSVAVMGGVATLLGYSDTIVAAVYLAAIALALDMMGNLIVAAFSGFERMELGALAFVIQELAFLIVGAVVLYLRLPFLWLFVIFILSRFISLVASVEIYRRIWGRVPRPGFDWTLMKGLFRKTLPFAVNIALSPVFARVDVLLLSYFKGNVAVGYYEVASTLFYRLNVFARTVNLAIMPLIAREYPTEGRQVVRYVERAVKYQAIIAIPLTVLGWVLGDKIIRSLYGAEFSPTVLAFQIMVSVTFFRFVDNAVGVTLTAIGLEARRALATGLLAVFNIIINLIVLPRYSYTGAAVTSVITELGYFVLLFGFLLKHLPSPFHFRAIMRPMVASAVMAVPLLLLRDWSIVLLLPLGLIVYVVAALLLQVVTPTEVAFMLRLGGLHRLVPARLQRLLLRSATVVK
jgi:O-antigen/teichoic acid export membrane protein